VFLLAYYEFTREEFETKLKEIVDVHEYRVGDFTEEINCGERVYEVTTKHPHVRVLIYSSLGVNGKTAADVGDDAVRFVHYCMYKGKRYYKSHKKKLQRVKTIFKNLEKTLFDVNDFVQTDEISKWLYAIQKNEK
jgi:hypothetical protein